MRKLAALSLLLSLCALAAQAQTRPRRVGQTNVPTASTPAPTTDSNAPTARPVQPPKLGGAPTGSNNGGSSNPSTARQSGTTPVAASTRTGSTRAGDESEEVDDDAVVRVNTALVRIPVSIMDRDGKFIPDLRQADFRIFEDGVEQELAYFAAVDVPFTVALVIDTSNSTKFKLEDIQDAAIAFVNQLRPEDRVLVVSFDDEVRVITEATSDRYRLREAIRRTRTGGSTRLYDAVDYVINQRFNRIEGRKAIVLFTDGVDTTSRRASFESTVRDAEELDAIIYPVHYDTYDAAGGSNWPGGGGSRWPGRGGGSNSTIRIGGINIRLPFPSPNVGGGGGGGGGGTSRADYERGSHYLQSLTDRTGGRLYEAYDQRYLTQSFAAIAEELRRQYSLGYYPKRQSQVAERRQIKVRVYRPNLAVRARDSYIYKPSGAPDDTAQDDAQQQQPRQSAPPELRRRPFSAATR